MIEQITPEQLAFPNNLYANAVGVRGLYRLCQLTGGKRIYIPKSEALLKEVIKRQIMRDYENGGCTIEGLASKYGYSPKSVWNYLKEK